MIKVCAYICDYDLGLYVHMLSYDCLDRGMLFEYERFMIISCICKIHS